MIEKSVREKYVLVVGLEVHAQLLTESKIYLADSTAYGSEPNTNVSVITLAHPGTLQKLNRKVVEHAIRMGLACHCEISRFNIFDRKNYFYPDLPKGYQLTQDRTPICKGGFIPVTISEGRKKAPPACAIGAPCRKTLPSLNSGMRSAFAMAGSPIQIHNRLQRSTTG